MATKQSQIRLSDDDKAKLTVIQDWFGLPSASAAIRYAVRLVYRDLFWEEGSAKRDVNPPQSP